MPHLITFAVDFVDASAEQKVDKNLDARGSTANDRGDVLCCSAAAGGIDGDGRNDIIANEMVGNGLAKMSLSRTAP